MRRSLRPLEWFNLAKRHGWEKFLLHDDFYDDNGEATQPDEDVAEAELYPAPTLNQISEAPHALLDYSVTRWSLEEDVLTAWLKLPKSSVLTCIFDRFDSTSNPYVRAITLEVAALLATEASEFVKHAWEVYPDCGYFWCLAEATAACLPEADGFQLVTNALGAMPEKERRQMFGALAHFRSPRSLDWIEAHVSEPIVDAWGYLAAASNLSWPKVEAWFAAGRPLSLVAIDGLTAIARPQSPLLQRLHPILANPPSETELRNAIEALMRDDIAPRVQQRGSALIELIPILVNNHVLNS